MATAALRREGRRIVVPVISRYPINPLRLSVAASEEHACLGVRFISTQVVRNQMKIVKNIQKITKAMKMVAASKLRAIQTKAENSRGLWQPFNALLGDLPSVDVKKNVVTISSVKGLCGGVNSTAVKISRGLHKLNSCILCLSFLSLSLLLKPMGCLVPGPEKECKYVILGEKAKAQVVRDSKKDIELSITELQKNHLNYTQVAVLADDILKNVEYDALRIVYNKFHSVVSFFHQHQLCYLLRLWREKLNLGGNLGNWILMKYKC